MANQALPCPTVLRLLLRYEPETGKLFWRERARVWFASGVQFKVWAKRYANQEAFTSSNGDGYLTGAILGRPVKAHRAAWTIANGRWPADQIDHINGNRSDNRLENLREVSAHENTKNQAIPSHNTSGHIGVSWAKTKAKWCAYIRVNNRLLMLGHFAKKEDAIAARAAASEKHGFHDNHGKLDRNAASVFCASG